MDGIILVVDDDRMIRTVLTQVLMRVGCKVHAMLLLVMLMCWVEEGKGDLVIFDVIMFDGNGLEQLSKIAALCFGLLVIVISVQNTIMIVIQAAEADVYDYLPKPFDLPDLMKCVACVLETKCCVGISCVPDLNAIEQGGDLLLVGCTGVMQVLYRLVAWVMNIQLLVLIIGESGTGKLLIVCVVYDFSDWCSLPFIVVVFADLDGMDGLFMILLCACGGMILFDEVSDLTDVDQARIVRMLDTLGENVPRIMVILQNDLMICMENGSFCEDLFYWLGGVMVVVLLLCERVDDILLLADYFLACVECEGALVRWFGQAVIDMVCVYSWFGNVRQLENAVCWLVFTVVEDEISRVEVEMVLGNQFVIEFLCFGGEGEKLSVSVGKYLW